MSAPADVLATLRDMQRKHEGGRPLSFQPAIEAVEGLAEMFSLLGLQINEHRVALREEREHSEELARNCEEMTHRLERLEQHLSTLAKYAGGDGHIYSDDPPKDPFPDAAPVRRKRKAGAA